MHLARLTLRSHYAPVLRPALTWISADAFDYLRIAKIPKRLTLTPLRLRMSQWAAAHHFKISLNSVRKMLGFAALLGALRRTASNPRSQLCGGSRKCRLPAYIRRLPQDPRHPRH